MEEDKELMDTLMQACLLLNRVDQLKMVEESKRTLTRFMTSETREAKELTVDIDRLLMLLFMDREYYVRNVDSIVEKMARGVKVYSSKALAYVELVALVEGKLLEVDNVDDLVVLLCVRDILEELHRKLSPDGINTCITFDPYHGEYGTANISGKREYGILLDCFYRLVDDPKLNITKELVKATKAKKYKMKNMQEFISKGAAYLRMSQQAYKTLYVLTSSRDSILFLGSSSSDEDEFDYDKFVEAHKIKVREYVSKEYVTELIRDNMYKRIPDDMVRFKVANAGAIAYVAFKDTVDIVGRPCIMVCIESVTGAMDFFIHHKWHTEREGIWGLSEIKSVAGELNARRLFALELYADLIVGVDKSKKRSYAIKYVDGRDSLISSVVNNTNIFVRRCDACGNEEENGIRRLQNSIVQDDDSEEGCKTSQTEHWRTGAMWYINPVLLEKRGYTLEIIEGKAQA